MGELWKNLSDSEKKKFNDLAEKDKERYIKEKEISTSGAGEKKGKPIKKSSSKLFFNLENTKKGKSKSAESDDEDSE
jgi:hypothetical protein